MLSQYSYAYDADGDATSFTEKYLGQKLGSLPADAGGKTGWLRPLFRGGKAMGLTLGATGPNLAARVLLAFAAAVGFMAMLPGRFTGRGGRAGRRLVPLGVALFFAGCGNGDDSSSQLPEAAGTSEARGARRRGSRPTETTPPAGLSPPSLAPTSIRLPSHSSSTAMTPHRTWLRGLGDGIGRPRCPRASSPQFGIRSASRVSVRQAATPATATVRGRSFYGSKASTVPPLPTPHA